MRAGAETNKANSDHKVEPPRANHALEVFGTHIP